jgi:hypothetical protein
VNDLGSCNYLDRLARRDLDSVSSTLRNVSHDNANAVVEPRIRQTVKSHACLWCKCSCAARVGVCECQVRVSACYKLLGSNT